MADLQSCQKLFAAAPQVLDDLNETDSHNYEDDHPGLGYSISFMDPKSRLTVFFYDYQQNSISSETALESFKEAARDIHVAAEKRGADTGKINAYQVKDRRQLFPLRAEAETSDGKSEFLALGVVSDCIVKVRFTAKFSMEEAKVWMTVILNYLNEGYG